MCVTNGMVYNGGGGGAIVYRMNCQSVLHKNVFNRYKVSKRYRLALSEDNETINREVSVCKVVPPQRLVREVSHSGETGRQAGHKRRGKIKTAVSRGETQDICIQCQMSRIYFGRRHSELLSSNGFCLKGQKSQKTQKEAAVCLVWEVRDSDAALHQPGI